MVSDDTLVCEDFPDDLSTVSNEDFRPIEVSNQSVRNKFCEECKEDFLNASTYLEHCYTHHRDYFIGLDEIFHRETQIGFGSTRKLDYTVHNEQAFNGVYETFYAKFKNPQDISIEETMQLFDKIVKQSGEKILKKTVYKLQLGIELRFHKETKDGKQFCHPAFNSVMYSIFTVGMIQLCLENGLVDFKKRTDEFIQLGSGWNFDSVTSFKFSSAKFHPLHIGQTIILPIILRKKRCIVNVPADDGKCFERSIRAHKQIDGNIIRNRKCRLENLDFYKNPGKPIDWTGIKFPFQLSQITRFETQNPQISLCIISYDENRECCWNDERTEERTTVDAVIESVVGQNSNNNEQEQRILSSQQQMHLRLKNQQSKIRKYCLPIYACAEKREIEIDLLLVSNNEVSHFVLIDNLRTLLKSRNNKSPYICRLCLQGCSTDFESHMELCRSHKAQKTQLPNPGRNWLTFTNYSATEFVPFTFIADFECIIVKQMGSSSNETNVHVPSGYSWVCIDHTGKKMRYSEYRPANSDEEIIKKFLKEILDMTTYLDDMLSQYELQANSIMTNLNSTEFSDECFFCKKTFLPHNDIVRHHSHIPPFSFKGLAHNACNLQCKTSNCYPVFFHNLSGYDCHHIVQSFTSELINKIKIIAQSQEKFLSIIINQKLRFVDSLLFFHSSLDKVSNSMSIEQDFILTREHFSYLNANVNLILEKGIYPYSYMDSFEKFNETSLPAHCHFFNDLTDENVSLEQYEKAKTRWRELGITDMGMYHDTYMAGDTFILADALVKMRKSMYNGFGLDIFHYFTLPHFCFDAALKKTGASLELLTNSTMHLWFESAIRGGLVSCGDLRVASANNPYCLSYNPKQPTSYIMYWDMNNLYSGPLKGMLPISNYEWLNERTLNTINRDCSRFIMNLKHDGSMGYFFEVDMFFPDEIHDKLNPYPPAPQVRTVSVDEISRSQGVLMDILNANHSLKFNRLIADLIPRKNYICHYRALQHYVELGAIVQRVHRGVSFIQYEWLKPYIEYNTLQRQNSNNALEKSFWKLANNCLYGKFIENKRNRQNIVLVSSIQKAMEYNRKVSVKSFSIINEKLVSLSLRKLVVTLDRPVPIGCAILDESKRLMSEFHYEYICQKYPNRFALLATDTDSFIYKIYTENVYEDCAQNFEKFDLSNYDCTNPIFGPFHNASNKLVIGKMKDEFANNIITHFAISKPKMYALKSTNPLNNVKRVIKKAKGVQRSAVTTQVKFKHYVESILTPLQTFTSSKCIRSQKHRISTVTLRKKAINGLDLKRFILDDCVNTLAFGHKDISLYQ